jgi:hypothetical protein
MKESKKIRLQKAGWIVGAASDFLSLTSEEALAIEEKISLVQKLKAKYPEHPSD